jgi:hypothetical protein
MLWAESGTSEFLTSIPDRDNTCGGRSCVYLVRVFTIRGTCFYFGQGGIQHADYCKWQGYACCRQTHNQ